MIPAYALYRRSRAYQDLSVEEQRQAVRAWAAEQGYRIVREFADDASGLDTERRGEFLTLLQICAQPDFREADVVLCYDISRFSRLDPEEAGFHEYSLRRAGVRVLYTHEPGANEGGVTGHLVKSLKRVLAHEYSQKLSQVVSRGLRAHAERGDWTGGPPPYGYRRAVREADMSLHILEPGRWKAKGERVSLVVDAVEAAIVRDIFDAYATRGWGLAAIAHRLNERAVPPPTSLRRQGVPAWTKSTIWAILRNPIYRGTLVYAKTGYAEIGKRHGKVKRAEKDRIVVEQAFPEIVPRDLWEAAQAKRTTQRYGVGRPWHRPYLLSSMIACEHCGKKFQAHQPTRRLENAYYVCGGYIASGVSVCDGLRVPMSYLDEAVLDGIQKRLDRVLDRDVLRQRLRQLLETDGPREGTIEALEARLAESRRRIARLVDVAAAGSEDLPSVRAALVGLERERAGLEAELAETRARAGAPERSDAVAEALIESLSRSREILEAGDSEERRRLVRAFLHGVEIRKTTRQAILSWYRLLNPAELSVKLVAPRGIDGQWKNPFGFTVEGLAFAA
jgi:DNA invertase Pin-like site-specific DNA recombinase